MKPAPGSEFATAMAMTDATWKRHANPWSVWTRVPVLLVLCTAVWSRDWIGAWAWIPVSITSIWIWWNPRAFAEPAATDNWASEATFGERVWLNRNAIPIPVEHARMARLLLTISALGLPFLVWGLWKLELWPTVFGLTLIYAGKMWFLDRMVWLYRKMKDAHPEYQSWHVASEVGRTEPGVCGAK